MHIAFLAGLKRSITTYTTVSRNRIMVDLALGLTAKGHEVTIFGTGDSSLPGVRFVEVVPEGLNFVAQTENPFYTETAYITHATMEAVRRQKEFDIIHNHMYPEFIPLLTYAVWSIPIVTTVHAQITSELRLALADVTQNMKEGLVCISKSAQQRLRLTSSVVHNGVNANFFTPIDTNNQTSMLFVGRMSSAKKPDGTFVDPKGVQHAVDVARRLAKQLKIVGNVEDKEFYATLVAPYLSDQIQMVGDVASEQTQTREQMCALYQNAKLFIDPINWEEPFGLVVAEAMSCGTPVVAFARGAMPELIKDGETGFLINPSEEDIKGDWVIKKTGVEGLCEAVAKIYAMSAVDYQAMRQACRTHVENNFTIEKMVDNYEKVYKEILKRK